MTHSEHDEGIALLRRAPVLDACRDTPRTRSTLVETTGTSRTTVYRATENLEAQGLLDRTADGYRTTARGEALSNLTETYLDGLEAIERLQPLLEAVDHRELLEHAHLLTDAAVTVVDPENPYQVVERSVERFEAASDVRGVVASASPQTLLESAVPIVETKDRIEWLFSESALTAHDAVGDEAFRNALDANHVSIGVLSDDDVPFTFSVNRDDVSISGHDPTSGLPTVLVETDAIAARAWLEDRFDAIAAEATPLASWTGTE